MNFEKEEKWIRDTFIQNGWFSLKTYLKGKKLFESEEESEVALKNLDNFLLKIGKKLSRKKNHDYSISWFKINLLDNAIPQLVGLGTIDNLLDLRLVSQLISLDLADQAGDTIICIFDNKKDWIIKLTNSPEEKRLYARLYGDDRLFDFEPMII